MRNATYVQQYAKIARIMHAASMRTVHRRNIPQRRLLYTLCTLNRPYICVHAIYTWLSNVNMRMVQFCASTYVAIAYACRVCAELHAYARIIELVRADTQAAHACAWLHRVACMLALIGNATRTCSICGRRLTPCRQASEPQACNHA